MHAIAEGSILNVGNLLARAIENAARIADCRVEVQPVAATRWASATFAGARHKLVLRAQNAVMLDRWLAQLPDGDFAIRGHLVADLVTQAVRREGGTVEAELEILTLEEG